MWKKVIDNGTQCPSAKAQGIGGFIDPYREHALDPNTNMRGPRGPRKTLKAAQTVIIEQAQTD